MRRLRLLPIAIIVLVGPLLLLRPFGVVGEKAQTSAGGNLADRVFVRDLGDQAAGGIELGEALVRRSSDPRARVAAQRFLARERLERRAAAAAGGNNASLATKNSRHTSRSSLPHAAARHAREDVLLARIELTSGRNPRLRTLARRLAARGRVSVRAFRVGAGEPR